MTVQTHHTHVFPEEMTRRFATLGLTARDIVLRFESIGENCELGFVQRYCGAEPLSLMRFSYGDAARMTRAVREGFAALQIPGDLRATLDGTNDEYGIYDNTYGMHYHTFRYARDVGAEDLVRAETKRLSFLTRKYLGDMSDGEKFFVHWRKERLSEQEITPLHEAMRAYGPAKLLWLVEPSDGEASGTVTETRPGLMKGVIAELAKVGSYGAPSMEAWLTVMMAVIEHQDVAERAKLFGFK